MMGVAVVEGGMVAAVVAVTVAAVAAAAAARGGSGGGDLYLFPSKASDTTLMLMWLPFGSVSSLDTFE